MRKFKTSRSRRLHTLWLMSAEHFRSVVLQHGPPPSHDGKGVRGMRFLFTIMLAVALMAAALSVTTPASAGEKVLVWVEYDGMRQQIAVDANSPAPTHAQAVAADNRQVAKAANEKAKTAQTTADEAKAAAETAQTTADRAGSTASIAWILALFALLGALAALLVSLRSRDRSESAVSAVEELDTNVGRLYEAAATHINAPAHEPPAEPLPNTWEEFISLVREVDLADEETPVDASPPADEA